MNAVGDRIATPTYRLWCCGRGTWCDYELATEPEHLPAIRSLCSEDWSNGPQTIHLDVELIPEPQGPRGEWAISVRTASRTLGYLDAADEADWAPVVRRVIASGLVPITMGQIWAQSYESWDSADNFTAVVRIRLGKPNEALPVNDPPTVPYTLLPKSAIVQVTREDQYSNALLKFVPPGGYGVFCVTLHEQLPTDGRKKPYVEVRIDDECVGELTPAMSQRFLPMIRHLQDRGLLTACWGDITGSAVAAEVRIDAVKANEASDEVLNGDPSQILYLIAPLPDPRQYNLRVMAPLLAPIPPMAPVPRVTVTEPPDGSVLRFSKSNGRYHYAAVRRGGHWQTTATADWGSINELMAWKDMAMRVRGFEIARAWVSVDERGNAQTREQFAVIRFAINGLYLVAINVAADGSSAGDWYTSIDDAAEQRLPLGDQTDWSGIARYGQYIEVAAGWQPL